MFFYHWAKAVASSLVGEDSLSHHVDPAIGVYIIDRYTYYALEFLEKVYSKMMFLVLSQFYYSGFKSNTHNNYNCIIKAN